MQTKRTFFLITIIVFFFCFKVAAQKENDSLDCRFELLQIKSLAKQGNHEKAVKFWKQAYKHCKTQSKLVYIRGIDLIEYNIKNTKDERLKKTLVDSMMYLYEERIKYFGQEGYVKGRQGVDLMRFDKDRIEEAYHILNKSLELQKLETETAVILSLMMISEGLYQKGIFNESKFIESYKKYIFNIDKQLKSHKSGQERINLRQAASAINQIYIKYAPPSCEEIVERFSEYFVKNKNHIGRLKKLEYLLIRRNCIDTELFKKVVNKIDSLSLSTTFSDPFFTKPTNKQLEDRINTVEIILELEMPDTIRARNLYKLAQFHNELEKKEEAKNYALKATQYNANFGAPYVLLAVMYTQESSFHNEGSINRYAVYWAAVDKLKKAKEVEPSIKEAVNKLIERYETYFPNREKAISFPKWKPGQKYYIGGWINETTVARFGN